MAGGLGMGGEVTTETMEMLSPEQEALRNQMISQVGGQIGQGVEGYEGQIVPGAGGIQQSTFDMIQQMLGGGGNVGQSQDVLSQILGGYDPAAAKKYWQQNIYDPGKQRLMQDIMPGVMEKYAGSGASTSGAARRAMAGASQRFETDAQGQLADILYRGQESATDRQLRAVQEVGQMQRTMADIGLTGGAQQRGIESEQGASDYQQWQQQQAYNNPWLQYYSQTQPVTSQMYEEQAPEGALSIGLGLAEGAMGAAGGAGGFGALFSDRRLKDDIKYI